jgi:hypothetical protein
MSAPDPEQAILDELAGPLGQWEPGATSPGGIQSGIVRGGTPFQADLTTVEFVKHRQSARRRLDFVTFKGTIPHIGPRRHTLSWLFSLTRQPDGTWRVTGGAGGGDSAMPPRSKPWINLAGGGWPDQFYAGGRIHTAGIDIARVQLRFADGLTLEDDTEQAIALFITDDAVRLPASVALLDHAGSTIASHDFPGP